MGKLGNRTFSPGYKEKEGSGPAERSMQNVAPKKGAGDTVMSRMYQQASSPLTKEKMRKPFGG